MKISLDKKKNRELILTGNIVTAILVLAIPVVLNSFIQTMYNLTDTFWLGKLGKTSLAAITLVSPVQNIVVNFGQGITTAGAILIAQYLGSGDMKNTCRMANQIFVCSMLFSVVCASICCVATPALLIWLGASGEVFDKGKAYLQIVILDMPFLFMINLFTAVNQAQGDTVRPMFLNLVGVIINIILDPLFIMVFEWGVHGAALATLLSKVPCALIAFLSLIKKSNPVNINLKGFRFEREKLMSIIKIGLPTAIGGSTMQFGFLLMTKNVLKYGDTAVSAYGIGNKINGLITLPSNAMGSAVSTIVAQNIGAKQKERARKAYRIAMVISVVFLFVCGMILSRPAVSTAFVKVFAHEDDVIVLASEFLSIMAFWCFTNGIYNSTSGLFNGSGHTMVTMIVDASRIWIFRFVTLFFCEKILNMGVQSIWYSVVVSNGISALILFAIYKTDLWRKDVVKIK